jgi:hypothetical protein
MRHILKPTDSRNSSHRNDNTKTSPSINMNDKNDELYKNIINK